MSESVSAAVTGIPIRGCAGVTSTLPSSCRLVTLTVTSFVPMLASSVGLDRYLVHVVLVRVHRILEVRLLLEGEGLAGCCLWEQQDWGARSWGA